MKRIPAVISLLSRGDIIYLGNSSDRYFFIGVDSTDQVVCESGVGLLFRLVPVAVTIQVKSESVWVLKYCDRGNILYNAYGNWEFAKMAEAQFKQDGTFISLFKTKEI